MVAETDRRANTVASRYSHGRKPEAGFPLGREADTSCASGISLLGEQFRTLYLAATESSKVECGIGYRARSPRLRHLPRRQEGIDMIRPSRRRDRRTDFEFFFRNAKSDFEAIAACDARTAFLDGIYSLRVVPGGRHGGQDPDAVEVFFGNRPYDSVTEPVQERGGGISTRRRLLAEAGATLSYQRMASGVVLCTLHPAGADGFRRRESAIILEWVQNPRLFTGRGALERHWRCFMSYMEYTSLEGDPTWLDRLRVWWLFASRGLIVDGKHEAPWGLSKLSVAGFFVFAVGLSGWLLTFGQWLFSGAKPPGP